MLLFFFKQKTAYDMRISDWSSDVCSSDLPARGTEVELADAQRVGLQLQLGCGEQVLHLVGQQAEAVDHLHLQLAQFVDVACGADALVQGQARVHVGQVVVGDQRRNVHQHLGAVGGGSVDVRPLAPLDADRKR